MTKPPFLIAIDNMGTKIKDDAYAAQRAQDGWWTVHACIADVPAHIKPATTQNKRVISNKFKTHLFDFKDAYKMSLSHKFPRKMIWVQLKLNPSMVVRDIKINRIEGKINQALSYKTADHFLQALQSEQPTIGSHVHHFYNLWRLSCLLRDQRPHKAARRTYYFKSEQIVEELAILVNSALAHKAMKAGQKILFRNNQDKTPHFHPTSLGHAGLKVPAYAWFTSPLWRYVDLVNLRAILGEPLPNKLYNLAQSFNKHEKEQRKAAKKNPYKTTY